MFKDFIGQEIKEGNYVAYPGGGNAKAEYGLILYRIVGFDTEKKKIKAQRLDTFPSQNGVWPDSIMKRRHVIDQRIISPVHGLPYQWMVTMIESSLENPNKLVVTNPPDSIKELFDKVYNRDSSILEIFSGEQIAQWLLGSTHVSNPFKF